MTKSHKYSFDQSFNLKSKKVIQSLFTEGKSYYKYPLKVRYKLCTYESHQEGPEVKVAFTVPKSRHKKAVTRNLLKRRLRESFRLNFREQLVLSLSSNQYLAIIVIYTTNEIMDFSNLEPCIKSLLSKVSKKVTG